MKRRYIILIWLVPAILVFAGICYFSILSDQRWLFPVVTLGLATSIPIALVLSALAPPSALKSQPEGSCVDCGYDCSTLAADVPCPECASRHRVPYGRPVLRTACGQCEYDMHGLREFAACPECGCARPRR